ncbi:MAG: amino acid permease, partial [Saprospiraceae bacterium]
MAEKNLLPAFMRKVHPRFQTPHIALFITCGLMLLLTLTNTLLFLLTVNAIGTLLIYIITCASMIKLRKMQNMAPAAFLLPAGKSIAAISILFCILILSGSTGLQLLYTLCLLVSGILVYYIAFFRNKKQAIPTET